MQAEERQYTPRLNTLTLEQKKSSLDVVDANPERLKLDIAKNLGTPVSILSTMLRNQEKKMSGLNLRKTLCKSRILPNSTLYLKTTVLGKPEI